MFKIWSTFWANRARKRREEKRRHSQHIEDTFSERLASRSAVGKRKIDVGFTSQQNLNEGNEDGERRVTFSRFLRLWKGLRNSKRKPNNDEPRKDVVFTIPTENVFPKTCTRQQTYHQDIISQTAGINSHKCEVHQVTYDITEDCSNHNLHHLEEEEELENKCKNETCQVKVINEISSKENGSTETEHTIVQKQSDTPSRKTSEEKYIKGKEDGKSFSKESDVDSGCGSSCHEITTEPPITHAQLDVSSLVFQAQKMEATEKDRFLGKVCGKVRDSKELENTETSLTNKVLQKTKTEIALRNPNEEWSEFQKSQVANDSFEELIKQAKDGMSTLARRRVGTNENRNKISDYFQATPVDNPSTTHDTSTNTDAKKDENLDLNTESQLSLDARKVDSGVKFASSTSSCLNDTDNTNKPKILHYTDTPNLSDTSTDKTLDGTTTEIQTEKSMEQPLHCAITENHPAVAVNEVSHTTADNQPDKLASSTTVVEIPTLTLESELGSVKYLSEKTTGKNQEISCADEDSYHNDTPINNDQCEQGNFHAETDKSKNGNTMNIKQSHQVRIRESLLNNSQTIIEKSARPKSMVLPSTNGNNEADKAMYGLKVTSLEALNLPSQGQPPEHAGRIRSFSATIRRKLSFREKGKSDEMDIDEKIDPNNKKLKGFRSFRMNRKKKTKALRSDEASQSIGSLSDSNKYVSTIDKIFHENTGSAMFSDVPFTIPEISE